MGTFDRYVLSQLLLVFGFFALVLVGVYWINRAVILIDRFMGSGQPGLVVLELSLLTLPGLVKLVLPIAAFLAVLQNTNRLYSESELVVVQATGFSGFRLARPIFAFGIVAALMISVLAHFLVPLSLTRLNLKEAALAEAVSSRLLVPGQFNHPSDGVTVYVREIAQDGTLSDLMLVDTRDPDRETTFSAKTAVLIRDGEGPKLVMFDGIAQTLITETQQLSVTDFIDFTFAIEGLFRSGESRRLDPQQLSTGQLLAASEATLAATKRSKAWLIRTAHARFAEGYSTIGLCVLAFGALLMGTFNRFGLWRQVLLAVICVVIVKLLDNAALDMAKRSSLFWPVLYLPGTVALIIGMVFLWLGGGRLAQYLALFRRRRAQ
ncbi:MAG: LPS export ABC transporter permease LptF [Mangrovicoccus sp.]